MTEGRDQGNDDSAGEHLDVPTPLSFKIMVVLASLYLLYRLGQAVVWLFQALG